MRIIFFSFVDFEYVIVKLLYGMHIYNNYPDLGASEISNIKELRASQCEKKAFFNPL